MSPEFTITMQQTTVRARWADAPAEEGSAPGAANEGRVIELNVHDLKNSEHIFDRCLGALDGKGSFPFPNTPAATRFGGSPPEVFMDGDLDGWLSAKEVLQAEGVPFQVQSRFAALCMRGARGVVS